MPNFQYHCAQNGKTVTVHHPMGKTVKTWGELQQLGEALEPSDDTPKDAPVERWITGFNIVNQSPSVSPCQLGNDCRCR